MKKHRKIIAIQGDPLNSLNRKTDTTLLLALEAQKEDIKFIIMKQKILPFQMEKFILYVKKSFFLKKRKSFIRLKI